jgi:hypothetical protein
VFFLLAPLLHLIFDLLVIAAIIWAVMELVRFHHNYRSRT